jgi:hypothetical protein
MFSHGFKAISGLKVNLSKSKLAPIEGGGGGGIFWVANGVPLPMKYLGLPLEAGFK